MNQTKTPEKKRSWRRRILRFFGFSFLLLLLVLVSASFGLNWYLQSNKTKLIDQLEALHGGSLSFGATDLSIWKNFPSVSLSIEDILLHDSLYQQHQKPLLQLEELQIDLSLRKILADSLVIKDIYLDNGVVNIFSDSTNYNNLNSIFSKRLARRERKDSYLQIITQGLGLYLSNIDLSYEDALKHKRMIGRLNTLNVGLENGISKQLLLEVLLDIDVQEITFNTQKGSYLENSHLEGKLAVKQEEAWWRIPTSLLQINRQNFTVSADISTKQEASSIRIENEETHFASSIQLLTAALRDKLVDYQIEGKFSSRTEIRSHFGPGEDPNVRIDFLLPGNEVTAKGYSFSGVKMKGRFANRWFEDERSFSEERGKIRLDMEDLSCQFDLFKLGSSKVSIKADRKDSKLKTNLQVSAQASAISQWLNNQQFLFNRGYFHLNAFVDGSLGQVNEMLINSHANLELRNFDVIYRPVNALFPFDRLSLEKRAGDANFKMISGHLDPDHDYSLDGLVKNLPALLIDLATEQASSTVDLQASRIRWADFLNYFGRNGYFSKEKNKSELEKKRTLKETLAALENNFQPQISAKVDTLSYYNRIQLHDFSSGIHFENKHSLILDKTRFYYREGLIDISAKIDISQPYQTPFELNFHTQHLDVAELLPSLNYFDIQLLASLDSLPQDLNLQIHHKGVIDDQHGLIRKYNQGEIHFDDGENGLFRGSLFYQPGHKDLLTKINLSAAPELLNQFYNSENFFFEGGQMEVSFDYEGDMGNLDQLIQEAAVNLNIKDSEVYFKPVEVYFPIKELEVNAHQAQADFDILMRSDSLQRELHLEGNFNHLQAFLLNDESQAFEVDVEAYSPKFHWNDLSYLIQSRSNDGSPINQDNILQRCAQALLTTFDPQLKVRLDTFVYSDRLSLEKVYSGLHLKDSSILILEKTGFTFYEGSLQLDAKIDLQHLEYFPFELDLSMQDLDIGSLMRRLDYFSIEDLQKTKKLEGKLSMDMVFEGIYDGGNKNLIEKASKAKIDFNLEQVEIVGLRTIDAFAEKIHRERRFADLRFAPISTSLSLDGHHLHIPRMEIQSNALHLFVQGDYHLDSIHNIWVSIPVNNLKKPNLDQIPDKTGYALAGGKVFLELKVKEDGQSAAVFHLRNRKFYKQRDILPQFREDRKKYRAIRKAHKRSKAAATKAEKNRQKNK